MLRKTLNMSVVICLLLAVIMPASVAMAQQPLPPQTGQGKPDAQPEIDLKSLPEVVQKAVQLQQSLSPSQQAAIRMMWDQYKPEMMQIASVDMADPTAAAVPGGFQPAVKEPATKLPEAKLPEAKQPKTKRVDQNQAARTTAVFNKIDAGVAASLNADQLNLYRAVMKPEAPSVTAGNLPKPAGPDLATKSDSAPSGPSSYSTSCLYAAYYDALTASYYGEWAYRYNVWNYFVWGTTNSLYGYIYAYYALGYTHYAIGYSAPLYFEYYYTGGYDPGYNINSYNNNYSAYIYWYNSYYYANADYSGTSHTSAYYAQYYSYYSDIYMYNGQYYANTCN